MKNLVYIFLMTVLVVPNLVMANETAEIISGATVAVTSAPTYLTAKTAFDNIPKVLVDAKDDAAVFIATEGQHRGVRLQKALEYIRKQKPRLEASDMQIAESIVAL